MPQSLDSVVRHYVLTTENLARASGELHDWLGVGQGHTHTYTVELGFVNEVMMVGTSFIEVDQPVWANHRLHGVLSDRGGECTQMIVLQSSDSDALKERALRHSVKLIKDSTFQDQKVLQFDPEVFGTRFETYEYNRPDGWWAGRTDTYTQSTVVEDIIGAEIAVRNPIQTAETVADIYDVELGTDKESVRFADTTLRFVPSGQDWQGLVALDMTPLDPARRGESRTICGTDFRFV